jgi:hypothetical protein
VVHELPLIPNHFGESVSSPEKAGVGGSIPSLQCLIQAFQNARYTSDQPAQLAVKVVRHRVNRAVLLRGGDDAHATDLQDYVGQAYSFHQPLPDGHRPWKLRPLQGGRSEVNFAPASVRPIFIRVLLDCLAPQVSQVSHVS